MKTAPAPPPRATGRLNRPGASLDRRMGRFQNRRVVITGGASGIGKATAARFSAEGARVLVIDRNAAAGHAVASLLRCRFTAADVSRPSDVRRAFETVDQVLGGIDVLVNNAGLSLRATLLATRADEWRSLMATNVDGVFYVAVEAARRMRPPDPA